MTGRSPAITRMSGAADGRFRTFWRQEKNPPPADEPVPGFNVEYSDSDPTRAQKVCNALTSLILNENLRTRAEVAQSTTEFLGRQLKDAKRALDEQDAKLAAFKKQYYGPVARRC